MRLEGAGLARGGGRGGAAVDGDFVGFAKAAGEKQKGPGLFFVQANAAQGSDPLGGMAPGFGVGPDEHLELLGGLPEFGLWQREKVCVALAAENEDGFALFVAEVLFEEQIEAMASGAKRDGVAVGALVAVQNAVFECVEDFRVVVERRGRDGGFEVVEFANGGLPVDPVRKERFAGGFCENQGELGDEFGVAKGAPADELPGVCQDELLGGALQKPSRIGDGRLASEGARKKPLELVLVAAGKGHAGLAGFVGGKGCAVLGHVLDSAGSVLWERRWG